MNLEPANRDTPNVQKRMEDTYNGYCLRARDRLFLQPGMNAIGWIVRHICKKRIRLPKKLCAGKCCIFNAY